MCSFRCVGQTATYWYVKDDNQGALPKDQTYYEEQQDNAVIGAGTITLLELMEALERKDKNVSCRRISIVFNNKELRRKIIKQGANPSIHVQDARAKITQTKRIKKDLFQIDLTLVRGHKTLRETHQ